MNALAVLVVAVVLYVFLQRSGAFGDALGSPPRPGGADGSPNDANGYEHAIGAAAGAAACAAGGAALGVPQLGAQLAPACGALGGWAAPYVRKGVVAGAKGVAEGATYAYHAAESGVRLGMSAGQAVLEQPFDSAIIKPYQIGLKVTTTGVSALERGTSAVWHKLPAPLKVATAPVYVTSKVAATTVKTVSAVATPVLGTLSSGVKSATTAISSPVKTVLGWL